MPRQEAQWQRLTPSYRRRLERNGISKGDYLAGANLQAARGQRVEAQRTEYHLTNPSVPAASTVRAWKARAKARGIDSADWEAAIDSATLENFDAIQEAVRNKERAHNAWRAAGSPSTKTRKARRAGGGSEAYSFSEYIGDEPMEWGESWSYYH